LSGDCPAVLEEPPQPQDEISEQPEDSDNVEDSDKVEDSVLPNLQISLIESGNNEEAIIGPTAYDGSFSESYEIDLSQFYPADQMRPPALQSEKTESPADNDNCCIFDTVLDREWMRAMRFNAPISLVLIKVTLLEESKESDPALSLAVNLVKSELRRPGDFTSIYGDSIAVILNGAHTKGAVSKAEGLCTRIDAALYRSQVQNRLNCGIATAIPQRHTRSSTLMEAAGQALEEAIKSGLKLCIRDDYYISFLLKHP
jgi:GGDEF domain-containing protein